MYRLLRPWVCLVVLGASLVVNGPARSADAAVCLEMGREFYLTRDISSLQLNLLLFSAADKGCEFLARRLLAAGAAVESRDGRGAMPLARAARSGHLALVELLVDHGAPVNARDLAGSTALYDAAENDRVSVVRRLLEKGADPNLPGRSGVTPLAAAAFKGNLEIVELLLASGSQANEVDATGKTPIVYAAALGFTRIVRRLLDVGVDANARYGNDLTALMWAAGYADGAGVHDAESVVTLLIDRGAAIDAADNRGRTALMIATELGRHISVAEISLDRAGIHAIVGELEAAGVPELVRVHREAKLGPSAQPLHHLLEPGRGDRGLVRLGHQFVTFVGTLCPAKTGDRDQPGRRTGMATDLTIRESIAQAFFANPEQVRNDICRWAKCRDADVDVDGDVWIADPQSGHWLGGDDLARLSRFMGI